MSPLGPPLRALRQLDDPALLRVAVWSVAGAAAAFGAIGMGVWYLAHGVAGWNGWLAGLLGGLGAALLAHFLFLPVAGAVAGLFAEPIAAAVEQRFYPGLAQAAPASLGAQIWDGLALGLKVLMLQVLGLILTPVLPGASVAFAYGVAAWAIGRGLFVAVAMRHMPRRDAVALYAARRGDVLLQGAIAVLGSLVPLANLLVPVLAVAAMVHVLHAQPWAPRGDGRGLARPRAV